MGELFQDFPLKVSLKILIKFNNSQIIITSDLFLGYLETVDHLNLLICLHFDS